MKDEEKKTGEEKNPNVPGGSHGELKKNNICVFPGVEHWSPNDTALIQTPFYN